MVEHCQGSNPAKNPAIDVNPVFSRSIAHSEELLPGHILVRLLPDLPQHGQTLRADTLEQASQIPMPEALHAQILSDAEALAGHSLSQD